MHNKSCTLRKHEICFAFFIYTPQVYVFKCVFDENEVWCLHTFNAILSNTWILRKTYSLFLVFCCVWAKQNPMHTSIVCRYNINNLFYPYL